MALEVAHITRDRKEFTAYAFASAQVLAFSTEGIRRTNLATTSSDAFVREFARILSLEEVIHAGNDLERQRALLDALRGQRVLFILDNLEVLSPQELGYVAEFLNRLPRDNKAIVTTRYCKFDSALPLELDRFTELEARQLLAQLGETEPSIDRELHLAGDKFCHELYEVTNGNPLILKYALGIVKKSSLSEAVARIKDAKLSDDLYDFLFEDAVKGLPDLDRMVLSTCAGFMSPVNARILAEITGVSHDDVRKVLERLVSLSLVSNLRDGNYGLPAFVRTYMRKASCDVAQTISEDSTESLWYRSAYREGLSYWANFAIEHKNEPISLKSEWIDIKVAASGLWELTKLPDRLDDRIAAQMLINLVSALVNFLRISEYWDEFLQLSEWAYFARKSLGMNDASFLAYEIALTYCQRAEVDKADDWGEEFIKIIARDDKSVDMALSRRLKGLIAQQRRNYVEAEKFYNSSYSIFSELEQKYYQAIVLNDLAEINYVLGKYNCVQKFCDKAMDLAKELDDKRLQARCFDTLGYLFLKLGDLKQAYLRFVDAQTLASQIGEQELMARTYEGLACILEKERRFDESRNQAKVALELYKRSRNRNLDSINDLVKRLDERLRSVTLFSYTTLTIHITSLDSKLHQYLVKAIIDDKSTRESVMYFDDKILLNSTQSTDDYGIDLFGSLLSDDLCCVYDIAKTRADIRSGGRLRVQICIDSNAEKLYSLGWETLCYCRQGLPLPIAKSRTVAFSRFFELQHSSPLLIEQGPLQMLCVIANPEDLNSKVSYLNIDEEARNLLEAVKALRERGMQVTLLTGCSKLSEDLQSELIDRGFLIEERESSIDSIVSLLKKKHYHFLHFVGHGRFSSKNNKTFLSLEAEDGYLVETSDDTIIKRLRDLDLESLPKLIFLSTCESATRQNIAEAQNRQPFTGMAYKLMQLGIPAVIAMQDNISIIASRVLAKEFYDALAVDGIVDRAMNLARACLDDNSWYIPVLLTRFQDGYLFTESVFTLSS
ncbi:MAG: CHAT domain-containing protein [Anaerolineae bacterium]|nr:CHAT domain-containing protein [Anaerolineae bacterium]